MAIKKNFATVIDTGCRTTCKLLDGMEDCTGPSDVTTGAVAPSKALNVCLTASPGVANGNSSTQATSHHTDPPGFTPAASSYTHQSAPKNTISGTHKLYAINNPTTFCCWTYYDAANMNGYYAITNYRKTPTTASITLTKKHIASNLLHTILMYLSSIYLILFVLFALLFVHFDVSRTLVPVISHPT
jgi:hypothetical protein